MALVDVLIPTYRRPMGLPIVLTSLLGQTFRDFDVVVSDQTPEGERYTEGPEVRTTAGALRWRGHTVRILRHTPLRGMAEHRQFLLEQSSARYVHFLDDDVVLEPQVLERMITAIEEERCGFVGAAAVGLDFLNDERPHEQEIDLWEGPVQPERFGPGQVPWERHLVNNAANPLHLEWKLVQRGETLKYRVAWIGGANVLFDREKLLSVGGFSWWERLREQHAGEEALAQFLLLQPYGGCGILPSGTYHIGLPTTIAERRHNATELLAELLAEMESKHRAAS